MMRTSAGFKTYPHGRRSAIARLRSRLRSDSEGSAIIEMALIVPMMMALILGMFSFGIILNNYLLVTSAAGAGARALALSRGSGLADPCAIAVTAAKNAAPTLRQDGMTPSIIWTTVNASGTATPTSYTTGSCPGLASQLSEGDNIQMSITYQDNLLLYGWSPSVMTIVGQTNELVE